jgi:F-type H+-transporting ATPase subunit alpha
LNLEEDNVGVVLLGPSTGIKEGSTAKRTQRIASLKVGEQMVGRVVNTLGFPIDGKDQLVDLYNAVRKKSWLSSVSQLLSHYKQV